MQVMERDICLNSFLCIVYREFCHNPLFKVTYKANFHFHLFILDFVLKMSCVLTIEGFQLSQQFVVKELTILFSTDKYQHFHFNCPVNMMITPRDWSTIRYNQNYSGLDLIDDSFLPYDVIRYILNKISKMRIFTAGNQAKKFLMDYLPNSEIVDICQIYGFKYPLILEKSPCFISHSSRYCSLSKAKTVKAAMHIYFVNE